MAYMENGGNNFTRDQFGPGKAGEKAFNILNSAQNCGYKDVKEQCDVSPSLVLGFDIMGELEQIPLCEGHEYSVRQKITQELWESRKHIASFDVNGFGRS